MKVIRYVHQKAESLGADKSKVVIAGYSGGAMVACVAAHLLSKTNEQNLIQSMWLWCPMLSHEMGSMATD